MRLQRRFACQSGKSGVRPGSNTGSVRPHPGASGTAIGHGGSWWRRGWPALLPCAWTLETPGVACVDAGWIGGRAAGARPASRETSIRLRPGLPAHSGDHVLDRCRVQERGADQPFGDCINVHRFVQFGHAGLTFLRSGPNLGGVPQDLLRLVSRALVLGDAVHDFVHIELAFAQFFRPPTPWVERIPQGPLLISPAGSRVVVAGAVDD